jgi:TatD DNase family protein
MYIDSHAHLFQEDFAGDLHDAIVRSADAGVDRIVVPGTNLATSREALELADHYDSIYACVGIHPHEAHTATDAILAEIESMASHPKVVAIGEIGLDYHYDFSPRDRQQSAFEAQIELAIRRDLPIVVHTRESLENTLEIVERVLHKRPSWRNRRTMVEGSTALTKGVFHCFTGSSSDAARLFRDGFFVSYPGIVTFKNSPVVPTLKEIGFANILLETDSPYMAPVPLRGKRNEPANIIHIGEKLSEYFDTNEEEIAKVTSQNADKLFGLGWKGL